MIERFRHRYILYIVTDRTSSCQYNLFSKKNAIIWIFCISRWSAVSINLDKCSHTVFITRVLTITSLPEHRNEMVTQEMRYLSGDRLWRLIYLYFTIHIEPAKPRKHTVAKSDLYSVFNNRTAVASDSSASIKNKMLPNRFSQTRTDNFAIPELSGKYPTILNISRTGRVALM